MSSSPSFLATGSTGKTPSRSRAGVLSLSGRVHGLTRMTEERLRLISGVGLTKAAQILAAVELGRRIPARAPSDRPRSGNPRDVASYLLPSDGSGPVEQFGVVMLDTTHRVIRTTVLSIGTLDSSLVYPREVFRAVSECWAGAVVLFHNHPSGDPTPSPDDVALTKRLVDTSVLMGIVVLDYLVLADSKHFSFKEAGRI